MTGLDWVLATLELSLACAVVVVAIGVFRLVSRAAPLLDSPSQRSREATFLVEQMAYAEAARNGYRFGQLDRAA